MTIAREILNMFEFSRNQKNAFSTEIVILYRNKEMYPQIDEPFRCIDMCNRKASVVLWVHPYTNNSIIFYPYYPHSVKVQHPSYKQYGIMCV